MFFVQTPLESVLGWSPCLLCVQAEWEENLTMIQNKFQAFVPSLPAKLATSLSTQSKENTLNVVQQSSKFVHPSWMQILNMFCCLSAVSQTSTEPF